MTSGVRDRAGPTEEHRAASRLGFRPELDGLRGVAIILVMLVHLHPRVRGGFIGVDMFFTLSGFLITTLLLEEWRAHGRVSLRHFYARRALRLFPAVIVLLVAYSAFAVLWSGPQMGTRLAGVAYGFAYVSNWAQAFGWTFPETEIGYLWSLAVEEQFYLLWPGLLILGLFLVRMTPRRLIVAVTCIVVTVWTWRAFLTESGVEGHRVYFGTDGRLDQLLLGAALAAWFVHRPKAATGSVALSLIGWAGVGFLAWRLFDPVYFRAWYPTVGLAAIGLASTAIIACIVTDSSRLLKWALSMRWLRWVGTLSYSLYLWHVPAIRVVEHSPIGEVRLLNILCGATLSFALAAASYRYVERPFLRRRRAHERLAGTKASAEAGAVPSTPRSNESLRGQRLPVAERPSPT